MSRLAVEYDKTDAVGQYHAGEQDEDIGQPVDLVERLLIFFDQVPRLLTNEICDVIWNAIIIPQFARNFHRSPLLA